VKTLLDIENGKKIKILKISGGKGIRQHLQCLGIHVGDIAVLKRAHF